MIERYTNNNLLARSFFFSLSLSLISALVRIEAKHIEVSKTHAEVASLASQFCQMLRKRAPEAEASDARTRNSFEIVRNTRPCYSLI